MATATGRPVNRAARMAAAQDSETFMLPDPIPEEQNEVSACSVPAISAGQGQPAAQSHPTAQGHPPAQGQEEPVGHDVAAEADRSRRRAEDRATRDACGRDPRQPREAQPVSVQRMGQSPRRLPAASAGQRQPAVSPAKNLSEALCGIPKKYRRLVNESPPVKAISKK